jgi:hypothetical protein
MRCSRDNFSIEAAAAKGRDLPEWFMDEPFLEPGDDFYLKAFRDLDTCRAYGMSAGPIPWKDIVYYAERSFLDEDLINPFVYIIRAMDNGFREWLNKESEKASN